MKGMPQQLSAAEENVQRAELLFQFSNNLSRYFSSISRDFRERLKQRNITEGYEGLKLSFSQVLFYVPPEGISIADLALTNGVSKQAISKTVREIESLGFVERVTVASNSRSKRVMMTEQGLQLLSDASQQLGAVEQEYLDILGVENFEELQHLVSLLFKSLELLMPDVGRYRDFIPRQVGTFGVQLSAISEEFHRRIQQLSVNKGYGGMKKSFGQVITHLGVEGVRVVDIARINDVSKQAIGKIADEIEVQGYIEKIPDKNDGRSNSLVLTDKGLKLIADSVETINKIGDEFIVLLGQQNFNQLSRLMSIFYRGLALDEVRSQECLMEDFERYPESNMELLLRFARESFGASTEVEVIIGKEKTQQLKQLLHQLLGA